MLMLIKPYETLQEAMIQMPAAPRLLARALEAVAQTRESGLEGFEELTALLCRWAEGNAPSRRQLAPVLQRGMMELQRAIPVSKPEERAPLEKLQAMLMQQGPALQRICERPRPARTPQQRTAPKATPWWFRLGGTWLPCIHWLDINAPGPSIYRAGLSLWRQHRQAH